MVDNLLIAHLSDLRDAEEALQHIIDAINRIDGEVEQLTTRIDQLTSDLADMQRRIDGFYTEFTEFAEAQQSINQEVSDRLSGYDSSLASFNSRMDNLQLLVDSCISIANQATSDVINERAARTQADNNLQEQINILRGGL